MRTKTLALSALLGVLGSASVMAQNVYSINAVGYVNVTFPANSYTILTDPLIASPDNTLNTVLPNLNGQYKHGIVYAFSGGTYTVTEIGVGTAANASGWETGGADISLNPGTAAFFYNSTSAAMSATFVGTVPQSSTPVAGPNFVNGLTNTLTPGLNLVGSIVPASGDITQGIASFTNENKHDYVYTYDPTNGGYSGQLIVTAKGAPGSSGYDSEWSGGDPVVDQVAYGFFYWNNQSTNLNWVENFSVNP
jgi:hypothetical protein